jgi:spore coat protein CotH
MEVDGTTWCEVGMRWKGNSSLVQTWGAGIRKLPFRLDFDEYEDEHPEIDDQRYYGLEELVFGNGQGDDTLIREMLAADILAERGIPVAQSAFYQVWLDSGEGSTYLGLYTATEDPSDDLMERLYGDDQGNLYKPDGTCADLTCFDEESFEKKNNESAADWSDAQALVEALNGDRSDPAAWRAELEASLDVQAWLRWLAVNTAMENWDTYGGLAHNYYLYARPDDGGRLAWVPWDHNLSLQDSFTGSTDPMYDDLGEEWPLIRYLLDDPEYRADYEEALVWSQEGLLDEELLAAQSAARAEQVREALFGEGGEVEGSTFLTNEADWESALQSLLEHSAQRRSAVEAALNR